MNRMVVMTDYDDIHNYVINRIKDVILLESVWYEVIFFCILKKVIFEWGYYHYF